MCWDNPSVYFSIFFTLWNKDFETAFINYWQSITCKTYWQMKWINYKYDYWSGILISYICRKTETLRELTETCWNEERVSLLLKLYRNLLHQVSADWNFAETFQFVSALLKLDWNLHIRFPLTETWRNPAETIQ